jgi:16S rRNA (adenine1518-N6/adenine1519-N6)-dimethyltransferase
VKARSLAGASLERLRQLGIQPNRELGQHFLVDDNILGVIGRGAELTADDVVLEIGGGLGVLSEFLAERCRHVHVVESDARLEPALRDALSAGDGDLVIADVMEVDLAKLVPAPNKVVANLPYGVAVPAIIRTIDLLPSVGLWCVMVQREVADRLAARPAVKAYGIPSVMVQLACSVELLRRVSPGVFYPHPNVDSALVRLERTAPAPPAAVSRVVHAAFAHRRKALPRSLELALGSPDIRTAARAALEELGHPPDERAERLSPGEFSALAASLEPWL